MARTRCSGAGSLRRSGRTFWGTSWPAAAWCEAAIPVDLSGIGLPGARPLQDLGIDEYRHVEVQCPLDLLVEPHEWRRETERASRNSPRLDIVSTTSAHETCGQVGEADPEREQCRRSVLEVVACPQVRRQGAEEQQGHP